MASGQIQIIGAHKRHKCLRAPVLTLKLVSMASKTSWESKDIARRRLMYRLQGISLDTVFLWAKLSPVIYTQSTESVCMSSSWYEEVASTYAAKSELQAYNWKQNVMLVTCDDKDIVDWNKSTTFLREVPLNKKCRCMAIQIRWPQRTSSNNISM